LIKFKIVRLNYAGESAPSKVNTRGVTVEKQPAMMLPPDVTRGTMSFKFNIRWPALTDDNTGGSPILGYNIQYHKGISVWEEVIGMAARFEGTNYEQLFVDQPPTERMFYRIRARNRWGWGPFSD